MSIIALSFRFVVPFFKENLPHFWASLLGAVFIILCIAPFLRAIMAVSYTHLDVYKRQL